MKNYYDIPIYEIELPKNASCSTFYVRDGYFTYLNDTKHPYVMNTGTWLLEPGPHLMEPMEEGTNNWKATKYKEWDNVDKVLVPLSIIRKEHYTRFWQEMAENMMTDVFPKLMPGPKISDSIIVVRWDWSDEELMSCGLCLYEAITNTRLI